MLEVEDYPVAELVTMAAVYNPRKITAEEFERLKNKLKKFGCVEVIVVNKQTQRVVGGHQRVQAAKALGWEFLPVSWVDLNDTQEKELNLALNKGGGDWDMDALQILLTELHEEDGDLAVTGFEDEELNRLLAEADDDIDILGAMDESKEEATHQTSEKGNKEEDPKDILFIMGSFRFKVDLTDFELWKQGIEASGDDDAQVEELRQRLELS
jgi:ParB-like chromosome segregation protein Spo0J